MYYKYISNPDALTSILINNKIMFRFVKWLNDPLECQFIFETLASKNIKTLTGYFEYLYFSDIGSKGILDIYYYGFSVLSLSKTKEDLLMWAHYANSHKGAVIEFDESNEFFVGHDDINEVKEVTYLEKLPVLNITDSDFKDYLYYKSVDWKYEKEVRMTKYCSDKSGKREPIKWMKLNSESSYDVEGIQGSQLVDIPDDLITALYLGVNFDVEKYRDVLRLISKKVPIYKMIFIENEFKITQDEFDIF